MSIKMHQKQQNNAKIVNIHANNCLNASSMQFIYTKYDHHIFKMTKILHIYVKKRKIAAKLLNKTTKSCNETSYLLNLCTKK